ncbi:uncharacterized protein EAF01_005766 [Botrytis porri]|uniref:uncharacterized protein n=1 Tax=Botrytis porri TaxID=87229 RepID=UPI0018FFFD6D|nr:uncharacterized protein EAF01_005766 [Botrytis porri]KAF7905245.1 hypothetical protein EAF01_005766 [Botrytis porri]
MIREERNRVYEQILTEKRREEKRREEKRREEKREKPEQEGILEIHKSRFLGHTQTEYVYSHDLPNHE